MGKLRLPNEKPYGFLKNNNMVKPHGRLVLVG